MLKPERRRLIVWEARHDNGWMTIVMEQPDGTFIPWAGSVVSQLTDSRRSDPLNEFASVTNGRAVTLASHPRLHSMVRLSCSLQLHAVDGRGSHLVCRFADCFDRFFPQTGDRPVEWD